MPKNRGLTDESILSLPPSTRGKRYEVADIRTPNLFVRVGTKKKVFIYCARFAGAKDPSRKTIGKFPAMSVDEARQMALQWSRELEKGLDPKEERKRRDIERLMIRRQTFRCVVEDYIVDMPARVFNRHVAADIATIRHDILDPTRNAWLEKPIAEVTDADVAELIASIRDRPAPATAIRCLSLLRTFFNWAMSPLRRAHYGLTSNPIATVTTNQLELSRRTRTVLPTTYELRAYWKAADDTPYPYGPFYKALLLTGGVRRSELANSRWPEFDFAMRLWTVPESRVKHGPDHLVPLTDEMISLLEDLRRDQPQGHGDYVFSTTNGQKPINGFGKAVTAFRARMQEALMQIKPEADFRRLVLHDTRRVVRSALSALDVPNVVAESIIGHGRKGIEGVYDQHTFLPQRRRALSRFTSRLKQVLDGSADYFAVDDTLDTGKTTVTGRDQV